MHNMKWWIQTDAGRFEVEPQGCSDPFIDGCCCGLRLTNADTVAQRALASRRRPAARLECCVALPDRGHSFTMSARGTLHGGIFRFGPNERFEIVPCEANQAVSAVA